MAFVSQQLEMVGLDEPGELATKTQNLSGLMPCETVTFIGDEGPGETTNKKTSRS